MTAPIPFAAKNYQLADYFTKQCKEGRGNSYAFLDRRGLGFLQPKHHGQIALGIPPEGETHDDKTGRVFLSAKY